jgi:hypothetical protein
MMRTFLIVGVTALFPLASVGFASDIKPFDAKTGLWEGTSTMEREGMPAMPPIQIPPEKLAQMPPEQRAKVEEMIKSRSNLNGPQTTTSRSCLTRESFEKGMAMGEAREASSCTRQIVSSTSSRTEIHFECAPASGAKSSGDIVMERVDSEHMKGQMISKSVYKDRPINIKMTFSSKWISSDCGDVKPVLPK